MNYQNVEKITVYLYRNELVELPHVVGHDKPDIVDITDKFIIVSYRDDDGSIRRYFYNIDLVIRFDIRYRRNET